MGILLVSSVIIKGGKLPLLYQVTGNCFLFLTLTTYEGTAQGDTLQFPSFMHHSIEDFELVKSLKGFRPIPLLSKFIAVLLNFRPIPEYLPKKINYGILT